MENIFQSQVRVWLDMDAYIHYMQARFEGYKNTINDTKQQVVGIYQRIQEILHPRNPTTIQHLFDMLMDFR